MPTSRPSWRPPRRCRSARRTPAFRPPRCPPTRASICIGQETVRNCTGPSVARSTPVRCVIHSPSWTAPPKSFREPEAEGIAIGMTVPTDRPDGVVALVGGRVVTMNGDEIIERGTVVIEGDRITAIGPSADVALPAGAPRGRHRGQDRDSGPGRRPLAWRARHVGDRSPAELVQLRGARVRRHHDPRPIDGHQHLLRRRRDGARGRDCGAALVLHRHHPLRRQWRLQGRNRLTGRRALPPAPNEGSGRVQRQELQPTPARPTPAGGYRRPRARNDGRTRGWVAVHAQHDHGGRRPHGHRARDPGRAHVRRRDPTLVTKPDRLHSHAGGGLRWHLG